MVVAWLNAPLLRQWFAPLRPLHTRSQLSARGLWYAMALGGPLILTFVQWESAVRDAPLFTYFFFALIVARFGGLAPAILSIACAGILGNYFFLDPVEEFTMDGPAAQITWLFLLTGSASAIMLHSLRWHRDLQVRLTRQARELQQLVALEQGKVNADLLRSVRERDDFLAVVGHELKTPLTALSLQAHSLLRKARRSEGELPAAIVVQSLEKQVHSIERLIILIEQVLDVSRINHGRLSLHIETFDLFELARTVVTRMTAMATQARCTVEIYGQGPLRGEWDSLRLEQVLSNLLGNAFKYGGGGPIVVEVRRDDGDAVLIVTDHGPGIPLERQNRIFNRFERSTINTQAPGLGLGLWIVREIVEALDGKVSVRSQPGSGATFVVRLPCQRRPAVGAAPQATGVGPSRPANLGLHRDVT